MDTKIAAILGLIVLIPLIIILTTFFGGVAGWITGLFFEDEILKVLASTGIEGVTMWEIGCFLGFFGGFFKQPNTKDK